MPVMNLYRTGRVLTSAAALAVFVVAAAAQTSSPRPPAPSDDPSGAALSAAVVGIALAALVMLGAGLKSKRGHQD